MPMIRIAVDADVPALAALRYAWHTEDHGPVDDPGFEERFAAWHAAESGQRITWVADTGDGLVGSVNLKLFVRMPRPLTAASRWGYLGNAYVLPTYRDRGIGSRLLAAVASYGEEHGLARIVLSPSQRSVHFYRRAGFGPADMLMAKVCESLEET